MPFDNTAPYRVRKGTRTDFDQGVILTSERVEALFASALTFNKKEAQMGICLAYSLAWIRNKVLPLSERIRTAPNRLENFQALTRIYDVIGEQDDLGKLWDRHDGDLVSFLKLPGAKAPQPVSNVCGKTAFLSSADVIVTALIDTHVPCLMVYSWQNAAHAIVIYKTMKRTIIFDPNCGELSCGNDEAGTMWDAYVRDLKSVFGSAPSMCSVAAVGVVPAKT